MILTIPLKWGVFRDNVIGIMGIGIYTGSITMAFLFSALVVALISAWIRQREEPKLAERFGDEYIAYADRTSFLIPMPLRKRS